MDLQHVNETQANSTTSTKEPETFELCNSVLAKRGVVLTEHQKAMLQPICAGGDHLCMLRTGGGKSLIWQALSLAYSESHTLAVSVSPLCVVVLPTIALCEDAFASTTKRLEGTTSIVAWEEHADRNATDVTPSIAIGVRAVDSVPVRPWRCRYNCRSCSTGAIAETCECCKGCRGDKQIRCVWKCNECVGCKRKKACTVRSMREEKWRTAETKRLQDDTVSDKKNDDDECERQISVNDVQRHPNSTVSLFSPSCVILVVVCRRLNTTRHAYLSSQGCGGLG